MVVSFALFVCGYFVVPVALFGKVPPFLVFQYQIKRDMPLPVAEVHVACLTFLGFFWEKSHNERVVIVVYLGVQALTSLLFSFCWRGWLFGGAIFGFVSASLFPGSLLVYIGFCQSCFCELWPGFFRHMV